MKSLWFKSEFVAAILAGEKCDTIRADATRLPRVGELVRCTVGPRPPFAIVQITHIEPASPDLLAPARAADLARMNLPDAPLVRLAFVLAE